MAWHNGGRYYVRKVWAGGTCRSEYIGAGAVAALLARADELERQQLAAERRAWSAQVEAQAAIDRQIDDLGEQGADLVAAVMLASGHRQHKRQWRKQRDNRS